MTNNFSSTFIFFRFLNSLLILLIFFFIYKKFLKNYFLNLENSDQEKKKQQKNNLKQLQKDYLLSEQNLQEQASEMSQILSNAQIWQKKIDLVFKSKKQEQEFLFAKLQEQAKTKAKNHEISKSLHQLADKFEKNSALKNSINQLFAEKKTQENYIKKSLELINEH